MSNKESHHLRSRLARLQMASLPPLKLLPRQPNQTDQEKSVTKEVSALHKVWF